MFTSDASLLSEQLQTNIDPLCPKLWLGSIFFHCKLFVSLLYFLLPYYLHPPLSFLTSHLFILIFHSFPFLPLIFHLCQSFPAFFSPFLILQSPLWVYFLPSSLHVISYASLEGNTLSEESLYCISILFGYKLMSEKSPFESSVNLKKVIFQIENFSKYVFTKV